MTQAYSDPERRSDPYSLPDVEVFYMSAEDIREAGWEDGDGDPLGAGWYWWTCLPGCMPDGDPDGPYSTEEEATEAAQDIG